MSGRAARRHGARAGNRAPSRCRRWRSSPSAARASRPRCSWSATPRPQTAWPLVGLIARRAGRRRDRLRHVRRRGPHQPRASSSSTPASFLIVVAAGILSYGVGALQTVGWLPGLSDQGLRHHAPGSTGRPGTARSSRASSTSRRPDGAAARRLAGLPRRRARAVPAPDARPAHARPKPDPLDSANHLPDIPKGPPRERLCTRSSRRRRGRRAAAGLALAGCQAKESESTAPASGDERTRRDHRRRLRHRVRAVGHRGQHRRQAPSSSPTTAPRSPSSTSTARASG